MISKRRHDGVYAAANAAILIIFIFRLVTNEHFFIYISAFVRLKRCSKIFKFNAI